jgi:glutathione synthase/RimK-type ligase-like ATP-grasp enzyme
MKKLLFVGNPDTSTSQIIINAFKDRRYTVLTPKFSSGNVSLSGDKMCVTANGQDVSDADIMMIRSMDYCNKNHLLNASIALQYNGCYVIDAIERLKSSISSKATTSIDRFIEGVGLPTSLPSSSEVPLGMDFPLIVKPIGGKYCRGVFVVNNEREYNDAYRENNGSVIVQKYVPFEYENRVLVLSDGVTPSIIYIASKRNVARKGTKRKATFVPSIIKPRLTDYVLSTDYIKKRRGLIGYDIGSWRDRSGVWHHTIIEANYSPRFDRAATKLEIDVPNLVADKIEEYAAAQTI